MKRLFGLMLAAGAVWAGGCQSTVTRSSGGAIERPSAVEAVPELRPAAASESKRNGIVLPVWTTPENGGECSH